MISRTKEIGLNLFVSLWLGVALAAQPPPSRHRKLRILCRIPLKSEIFDLRVRVVEHFAIYSGSMTKPVLTLHPLYFRRNNN